MPNEADYTQIDETSGEHEIECRICQRGILKFREVHRLSGPVLLIGRILLIPSFVGMGFSILAVGTLVALAKQQGNGASAIFTGTTLAYALLGVFSFVSGLLGWILVMKKNVLQCTYCEAVVPAS